MIEQCVKFVGARHARFLTSKTKTGAKILDIGCGRGVTLKALARLGFDTHGFDVTLQAVEGIESSIKVKVAPSLTEAEYSDSYFDEIVIWHVLEHTPNPRDILLEIRRILKPNGVLIVAVPNYESLQSRWAGSAWFHLDIPRHLYHFPVSCLRSLLISCGFTPRSEHHFSLRQNPFGWVQSGLNRLKWLPRNGLYVLLHRRHSEKSAPYTRFIRFQLLILFWLSLPIAVLFSIFATIFRTGATVHIVATRD